MRTLAALFVASLFVVGRVHAEPAGPGVPVLHVVAVQSDDVDDQASALTDALRSRVRVLRGFSLGEGDSSLEVLTLALKCQPREDACQLKVGNQIHADRYIWGTVAQSTTSKQVVADLHLWTRGEPAQATKITYSDSLTAPGDDALKRVVDTALGRLIPRKEPAPGLPVGSPVALPKTPAVAEAPIAKARVALPSGSAPATAANVPQNAAPVTAPERDPNAPKSLTEARSDGRRTAGWAGIGMGTALVAAGIYSVVRLHSIDTSDRYELYNRGFGDGVDTCAQARAGIDAKVAGAASPAEMQDLCSQATTFKALQLVFFGLGAVSAGAGIFILATTHDEAPKTTSGSWSVRPQVGKSGGRIDLALAF